MVAQHDPVGKFQQAAGAAAKRRQSASGFSAQRFSVLSCRLQSQQRYVGGFLLRRVLSGGLAQRGVRSLDIEDVVHNLKREARRAR